MEQLLEDIQQMHNTIEPRRNVSKEHRQDHALHMLRKLKSIRREILKREGAGEDVAEARQAVESMWSDIFEVLLSDLDAPALVWAN